MGVVIEDDPRAKLSPMTAVFVTDEAVENWRRHHVCLCGCGQLVKPTRSRGGGWSTFRVGHNRTVAPDGYWRGRSQQSLATRRRISQGKRQHGIDSAGVGMLLEEYLAETGMQVRDFAIKAGVSRTWLSMVKTGTQKRIRRASAAKLLTAMGEEVPVYLMDPRKRARTRRKKAA